MSRDRKIAIIGIGPRGGYAFERVILELIRQNSLSKIHFSLFELTGNFGNGHVYRHQQNSSNWINITERILALTEREVMDTSNINIPSFPSYHQWIDSDFDSISVDEVDPYPPRAKIGKYLSQRFESLVKPLIESNMVALNTQKVNGLIWLDNNKIRIRTDDKKVEEYDEVLLTIGHQLTELSEQMVEWKEFADPNKCVELFTAPYPTKDYLKHESLKDDSIVGIRGFGLAMIDVVRAIAQKFGRFVMEDKKSRSCTYKSEKDVKILLIPFSLDGLPPAPKPINARIDSWYEPASSVIANFEKHIGNTQIQKEAESPNFLIESFACIAADIFLKIPQAYNPQNLPKIEIERLIIQWLEDQNFEHPLITATNQPRTAIMKETVDMALGLGAVSLDYCIGQVWRHCQPSIYNKLSFNACSDSVFADIIALDESTKRYSYGPPVDSIQQMLALNKAGILNLKFVKDPRIELNEDGWQFNNEGNSKTALIMIDSVLDAPQIKAVKTPIVKDLLKDDFIKVVHDDLGVKTDENGYLITKSEDVKLPIALLGRLAKGTIIGVDAILECFGSRPEQWAAQASVNHGLWLKNK